jgi:hypothetical protein
MWSTAGYSVPVSSHQTGCPLLAVRGRVAFPPAFPRGHGYTPTGALLFERRDEVTRRIRRASGSGSCMPGCHACSTSPLHRLGPDDLDVPWVERKDLEPARLSATLPLLDTDALHWLSATGAVVSRGGVWSTTIWPRGARSGGRFTALGKELGRPGALCATPRDPDIDGLSTRVPILGLPVDLAEHLPGAGSGARRIVIWRIRRVS